MANIISKELKGHDTTNPLGENWISQISAGGQVYDIATHHSITFKDGNSDTTGTTWNGLSDLEIIIPSITDIVQTPIEFAGTVGANGEISWNTGHGENPKTGNLLFVTVDCTFAGQVCEAGDMAIYAGDVEGWKIVSGENQVKIVGNNGEAKTTIMIGAAQDVLTVEGKTLVLALDYADLNTNHLSVTKGGSNKASVKFGDVAVDSIGIKLNKAEDTTANINGDVTVSKATKLTSGDVTFEGVDKLVTGVTFGTFNAGAFPEIVKNNEAMEFAVTGGSLTQTNDEHFVTSVSLEGKVEFSDAQQGDTGAFGLVGGITSGTGQSFVTGVNGSTSFTVEGSLQPTDGENAKYVKGLAGDLTSVVTSITEGSFTFDSSKQTFVTGFDDKSTNVISTVSVNTSASDVLASATVSNHVLSFGTTSVVTSASASTTTKDLVMGGYTYAAPSATTTSLVTAGFTKSSSATYTLNTAAETTYSTTTSYYKITTPQVKVSKAGYGLSNDGMKVSVSASTFAVGMTQGTLPSLTNGSVSWGVNTGDNKTLKGSVATGLDYENETVDLNGSTTLPGAYTLISVAAGTEGAITVGKAGELQNLEASVDLSGFVTDVAIVQTKA